MILLMVVAIVAVLWTMLTLLAERKGPEKIIPIGEPNSSYKALLIYNPDLFYNLDEQVCTAFATGLWKKGWFSKVVTVAAAEKMGKEHFDLFVFCANTYNWAPDWPIGNYIKDHDQLKGMQVVAITVGSGSTERSQKKLEQMLHKKEVQLLESRSFWLMKPNDETNTKEGNVTIALVQAETLGRQIAQRIANE